MAFGSRPVASLGKRSVYKTEFDIFKQNTDIDLISLVSFDENDSSHLENRSSYWSSKASGHKAQNYFAGQRKNFEQLNRNSVRIAYDPNYKCRRDTDRLGREFKPNIWNKGDTSIYKAFARTSKSFLRNRANGRKVERSRTCYSANEVHKPNNEELKLTRCQSTCERRTNEPNWIRNSKTNTQNIANVENKENTVNRNVNKYNTSTNKALWRTKSAPVTLAQNKSLYTRKQDQLGYPARGKSAKPPTRTEKVQTGEKPNVGRVSIWNEKRDFTNSLKAQHRVSPRELSIKRVELGKDVSKKSNKVAEEITNSDDNCKEHDSEINTEKQLSEFCDKSEADSFDKSDSNANTTSINGNTQGDFVNIADDSPDSKDSGFASNTVTPELDIRPVEIDSVPEQADSSKKHVKFACEEIEDGASSVDVCSVVTENALSDAESVASVNVVNTKANGDVKTYDINTLLNDLERFGANSRLSVISAGCHSIYSHEGGNDSLCGVEACKHLSELKASEEESKVEETDQELIDSAVSDLESTNMSKEARHAILETLQDMGVKTDRRGKDVGGLNDLKYRSVKLQRKQKDNRHKYEYFMRERTKYFYKQQFKSMDSVGNDETSSKHSSSNTRDCDDSTSDELHKGKLFPTITEMNKPGFRTNRSKQTKQIVTLENVRHKKHKIPGIGNYHMIASPDSDFEITPPGFDSRYNRPIISNDEMEIPPRFIRERSIQKCKNWLKRNISLSPLSLQPAANNKQLTRD
ncbi:hypothetical protein ACF0H5_018606 [Mactra antiquata]